MTWPGIEPRSPRLLANILLSNSLVNNNKYSRGVDQYFVLSQTVEVSASLASVIIIAWIEFRLTHNASFYAMGTFPPLPRCTFEIPMKARQVYVDPTDFALDILQIFNTRNDL